ncbi:MAG: hypothetical protein HFH41_04025 [Lachnospiraceae bacterium]|nr:hypothetical protein [Lachnospiraceae bacterium]
MGVTKETKETIITTIDEVFKKMNSISWVDRQKVMKEEAFKNTEKILYCYQTLKEHVEDEKEYLDMAFHGKSASFITYSKNKAAPTDEETILRDRKASYERSLNDVERIEKALHKIQDRKGYEVIELRYLSRKESEEGNKIKEELYTYEEIADILAKQEGYNDNLNEKTVRTYKNTLVKEMAVLLFGSDAI